MFMVVFGVIIAGLFLICPHLPSSKSGLQSSMGGLLMQHAMGNYFFVALLFPTISDP